VRGLARLLGADTTVFNPAIPYAFIGNGSLTLLPASFRFPGSLSSRCSHPRLVAGTASHRARVHIYAVGGNESAARLAGIKVWAVLIFVYGVSGLLAGLGGAMQRRASMLPWAATRPVLRARRDHRCYPGGNSFVGGIGSIWERWSGP